MKRYFHKILHSLITAVSMMVFIGCDTPQMCPPGIYRDFVIEGNQADYNKELDEIGIWMIAKPFEDRCCLPRNLSVRNIIAPEGVEVGVNPPNWTKGLPRMLIYIQHASKIVKNQYVKVEIWQDEEKKQTIQIGFAPPSKVIVKSNEP